MADPVVHLTVPEIWRVDAANLDLARQLVAIAERNDSLDGATDRFADWLRDCLVPRG